jgi:hypothetical protein
VVGLQVVLELLASVDGVVRVPVPVNKLVLEQHLFHYYRNKPTMIIQLTKTKKGQGDSSPKSKRYDKRYKTKKDNTHLQRSTNLLKGNTKYS